MQFLAGFWTFFIDHFEGFATILTIGGAVYLYFRQKKESKQEIATLLINDIRNAYAALQAVRESFFSTNRAIPDITVLPENNWKKFSYLFSKDLDEDDIDQVNKFFSNVERISYIVTQFNNLFLQHISTRMDALQEANINFLANSKTAEVAKKKISELDERFLRPDISVSAYNPIGFYQNLEKYLPEVSMDLLTSSVGSKLKRIAKPKKISFDLFVFLRKEN